MRRVLTLIFIYTGWLLGEWASIAQPAFTTPVPTPNTFAQPASAPAGTPLGMAGLTNGYVPDDSYQLRVGDTVSFQKIGRAHV